jgi:hypothetical protein
MGFYCAHLFMICLSYNLLYERDFLLRLSEDTHQDVIYAFN